MLRSIVLELILSTSLLYFVLVLLLHLRKCSVKFQLQLAFLLLKLGFEELPFQIDLLFYIFTILINQTFLIDHHLLQLSYLNIQTTIQLFSFLYPAIGKFKLILDQKVHRLQRLILFIHFRQLLLQLTILSFVMILYHSDIIDELLVLRVLLRI